MIPVLMYKTNVSMRNKTFKLFRSQEKSPVPVVDGVMTWQSLLPGMARSIAGAESTYAGTGNKDLHKKFIIHVSQFGISIDIVERDRYLCLSFRSRAHYTSQTSLNLA